jgi:hypothetical protein
MKEDPRAVEHGSDTPLGQCLEPPDCRPGRLFFDQGLRLDRQPRRSQAFAKLGDGLAQRPRHEGPGKEGNEGGDFPPGEETSDGGKLRL